MYLDFLQGMGNSKLAVSYAVSYARSETKDPGITMDDNIVVAAEKRQLAQSGVTARMHRLLQSCGPYALDSVAVLKRMQMEKTVITQQTITHLLQSMHDHNPPMAQHAEHLLLKVCYEEHGHMQVTPHMCNLVVASWCNIENLRRAELLVKRMDEQEVFFFSCVGTCGCTSLLCMCVCTCACMGGCVCVWLHAYDALMSHTPTSHGCMRMTHFRSLTPAHTYTQTRQHMHR